MPFLQFFRNWLIGWIGHALLVQPSKTAHRIFFYFNFNLFFTSETMVRSSAWSFGHSDPVLLQKWFHRIVLFHFCRYYVSLLTFFKIFTLWCVFVLTWSTFSFLLIFCCTKISAHRRELFFTENEVVALVKKWVLQGVP